MVIALVVGGLLALMPEVAWADISVERTPDSERGAVAGAVVMWGVAIAAVASHTLRRDRDLPWAITQAVRVPPRARAAALGLGQVGVGVLIVVALAGLAQQAMASPPPPGWVTLRPPYEVSALALRGDVVWAGGRDGLATLDRRSGAVLPPAADQPRLWDVKGLLVDRAGALWVAHGEGLARYADGAWSGVGVAQGLPGGAALALLEARDGALWVGYDKGLARCLNGTCRVYGAQDGLSIPAVSVIFQDRDRVLWFGSNDPERGGLTSFDGLNWRAYSSGDGLAYPAVNAILQDRAGALWFGTGFSSHGGASRLQDGSWTTLTKENGLAGEKVRSLFQDRDGRLWIGSEYDGIVVSEGGNWRLLTPRQGLAGWEVKAMLQDPDGVLWLGTENGVSRIGHLDLAAVGTRAGG